MPLDPNDVAFIGCWRKDTPAKVFHAAMREGNCGTCNAVVMIGPLGWQGAELGVPVICNICLSAQRPDLTMPDDATAS